MGLHLLDVDRPTKEGHQPRVGCWLLKTVKALVPQITNLWSEAETQSMRHAKHLVGIAPGIRVMFVNLQVGLVIEQAVYHMLRITHRGTDDFHPIGAILIRKVCVKGHVWFRPIAQIDLCCRFRSSSGIEALAIRRGCGAISPIGGKRDAVMIVNDFGQRFGVGFVPYMPRPSWSAPD